MLTLKHVIWNGDFETVYEAKQVRVRHQDRTPDTFPGQKTPIIFVAFDLPNGDVMELTFGEVYVINELGKTVTKYVISAGTVEAPNQQARGVEYRPMPQKHLAPAHADQVPA